MESTCSQQQPTQQVDPDQLRVDPAFLQQQAQAMEMLGVQPHPRNYRVISDRSSVDQSHILKVMSYNVLCSFEWNFKLYQYASEQILDPVYRCPRIVEEIKQSGCDVVALQELDKIQEEHFKSLEAHGYSLVPIVDTRKVRKHTIAMAYRTSQLKLIEAFHIDHNEISKEKCYPKKQFKKDTLGQFILFEHIATQRKVLVGNCHLTYHPKDDCVKHAQALYMLQRGAEIIREHGDEKTCLIQCGDFNSFPHSSVLSLLHDEQLGSKDAYCVPEDTEEKTKKMYAVTQERYNEMKESGALSPLAGRIFDVYNLYNQGSDCTSRAEQQPKWTNLTRHFRGSLDHIFINEHAKVLSLLEMPTDEEAMAECAIPSTLFPSDHVRIEVELHLL